MSIIIAFGLLTAAWVVALVAVVATTLAVKDILADRRRAKAKRAGFPWAA